MVKVDEKYCPKNHACPSLRFCPVDAIKQDSIYEAPKIDYEKCIQCGRCTQICRVFYED